MVPSMASRSAERMDGKDSYLAGTMADLKAGSMDGSMAEPLAA